MKIENLKLVLKTISFWLCLISLLSLAIIFSFQESYELTVVCVTGIATLAGLQLKGNNNFTTKIFIGVVPVPLSYIAFEFVKKCWF